MKSRKSSKPEKVQISISLRKSLVEEVDHRAKADRRPRSNYISIVLEQAFADMDAKSGQKTERSFSVSDSANANEIREPKRRVRLSPEQIDKVLKESEKSKLTVKELCDKYGVAVATFYRWKSLRK